MTQQVMRTKAEAGHCNHKQAAVDVVEKIPTLRKLYEDTIRSWHAKEALALASEFKDEQIECVYRKLNARWYPWWLYGHR